MAKAEADDDGARRRRRGHKEVRGRTWSSICLCFREEMKCRSPGRSGSNLVSYVLFEKPFCRALISLGFKDTTQRKEEILKFIT